MSRGGWFNLRGLAVLALLFSWPVSGDLAAQAPEFEARSIDGTGNNLRHSEYGSAGISLVRMAGVGYADGVSAPAGASRISPREISNILVAQEESILNGAGASDFVWQWGQFLDHDLDLTSGADPKEPFNIAVPVGDPFFDPSFEGDKVILLNRSVHDGGDTRHSPRQQLTLITAFIDASNVYGSDGERAAALRTFEGGKLKTTSGGLFLPFNTDGLNNAGGPDPSLFLAGDVRANEQIALTAMHTLFVREHNRLCDELIAENHGLSDEEIYQRARKIVGAQMQVITYNEFLPLVLGPDVLRSYEGYNSRLDAGIANEFSTAAYRFGHSMLSSTLLRVNKAGNELVSTSLRDAFFNPQLIHRGGGISPILRGLAIQQMQEVDTKLVDGIRNFLFGQPGEGGFDLASVNIQRGRDHGLAGYNGVRKAYDLKRVRSFSDVTSDLDLQAALAEAYDSVDDMDLWVAGLAEDHVPSGLVGETFHAILTDQFVRLRDGDRFWYRNDLYFTSNPTLMEQVESTMLADIIRRNTRVGDELQDHVFLVQ